MPTATGNGSRKSSRSEITSRSITWSRRKCEELLPEVFARKNERALHHHHAPAADMHGLDLPALLDNTRAQDARAAHVKALAKAGCELAVSHGIERGEQRGRIDSRGASRRIFDQAGGTRKEHPRLYLTGRFAGRHLPGIEIELSGAIKRQGASEGGGVWARLCEGFA